MSESKKTLQSVDQAITITGLDIALGALLKIKEENDRAKRQFTNVSNTVIEAQLVVAIAAIRAAQKSTAQASAMERP